MSDEEWDDYAVGRERNRRIGWVMMIAAGVLLLAPVIWFGLSRIEFTEDAPQPSSEMAIYHCREEVKLRLKDPGSAEFSGESLTGTSEFTVTGTVRAKNSFGGTAAHEYTCTANFDASDDSYWVSVQVR